MNNEMIQKVSEIAAQAAIAKYEELKQRDMENAEERRLYNTKLLLRNYRRLKLYCDGIAEVAPELDFVESFSVLRNMNVQSIKDSKARTFAMMKFIDNMLHVYKMHTEQMSSVEMKRQYDTIDKYYIHSEAMRTEDIAIAHNVSERTVQRDLQEATYTLSVLFFGADGIRVRL